MSKPNTTRSLGPIHFEDLDPHRFEDLARQLIYDFRNWQSIEATGRSGSDDGFDVRAFESIRESEAEYLDQDESRDDHVPHPMDGNLWMIQCKRERSLGPTKIKGIIESGVNPDSPPYGYILVAPANFSKRSRDVFRDELRKRAVMEFYMWGAGELEDMLFQPKNDHILFAFFGISLGSRRRTRTAEIRATVGAKNKLIRTLGEHPTHEAVLLRDIKDTNYPFEQRCDDFEDFPRWQDYVAVDLHALGLVVSIAKYYAYVDRVGREFDFTEAVNRVLRPNLPGRYREREDEDREHDVKGFWEQLPHANKAMFVRNGLIRFDAIEFIDDKGDRSYSCPHVYVDFHRERGAVSGTAEYLEINKHLTESLDDFKRIEKFPKKFPTAKFGRIHEDAIEVGPQTYMTMRQAEGRVSLYCEDSRYASLKPTDVVGVEQSGADSKEKSYLKITSVSRAKGRDLIKLSEDNPPLRQIIEDQIGGVLVAGKQILIVEAVTIYDWQIDQDRPVV